MLSAGFQTIIRSVTVSKVILVTHRLVALKLDVSQTVSAAMTKCAIMVSALIHASWEYLVLPTQNVMVMPIVQLVDVLLVMLAIHLITVRE